jgi:hypothetical protein
MDQFKAARVGNVGRVRELLSRANVDNVEDVHGGTALLWAVVGGFTECVKYLLEMGADVNACNNWGSAPLFVASLGGRVELVRVLLDAGAVVDATRGYAKSRVGSERGRFVYIYDGRTPLCLAVHHNHRDVARMLIYRGASIANVKLDEYLPTIPEWIHQIVASRSLCRSIAIFIIGAHKHCCICVTGRNDINVLRLVSKHIWSTRMDDAWGNER